VLNFELLKCFRQRNNFSQHSHFIFIQDYFLNNSGAVVLLLFAAEHIIFWIVPGYVSICWERFLTSIMQQVRWVYATSSGCE